MKSGATYRSIKVVKILITTTTEKSIFPFKASSLRMCNNIIFIIIRMRIKETESLVLCVKVLFSE